ncbi:MAG: glycosyltransferase family 39 protein, partial [Halobacteriota archaeon]
MFKRRVTKHEGALLVIVLLGTFLRVYNLGAHSLGTDDTWSVWIAPQDISSILRYTAADVHPPLYYVVLHFWTAYLGTSELTLKLLSIIFGVAAIPVLYLVGRELFDTRAGLLAAFLLAVSSFNIRYAQEVRMYSLLVFLGVLSMYFFIRLTRHRTPVTLVGYVIATTLTLYTHV